MAESSSSAGAASKHKETGLKLTARKLENFSEWYSQVIVMSEMIDYYEVRSSRES